MAETKPLPTTNVTLPTRALVLFAEHSTPNDQRITRLLDFFSVPWGSVPASPSNVGKKGTYVVITSADSLAEAIQAHGESTALPAWLANASTVYVHAFRNDDRSTKLLRLLTGDKQASLKVEQTGNAEVKVAEDFPEMCGPLSGMRLPITIQSAGYTCDTGRRVDDLRSIIATAQGEVFFALSYAGVRFYLNTWGSTVDIDALAPSYFDVKKSFCEAVPIALYLNWAFRGSACARQTSACLIVDDPPLRTRYGFLDFREALHLMQHHRFTTTVAFIPWNWRRNDPHTVKLFQSYPEKFSVVVHGCDHTSSEFAVQSSAALNSKIRKSLERMEAFKQRTSIQSDQVMVFPQGAFSPEAGRVLKLNGFVSAVNTEVAPAQPAANQTTIADLWNVAIMKYGTFPILTRRYASHGLENFAFDAILGKPCLIAAHHDVFRNRGRDLVDFISSLNSLKWSLVWRPLSEIVRRSFRTRQLDDGTFVVEMFANSLLIENPDSEERRILLIKDESDPGCVEAVLANQTPRDFHMKDGHLRCWLTTRGSEPVTIKIVYRNDSGPMPESYAIGNELRVAAKRYLSEIRDNYLSRSDFLHRQAHALNRLIR